MSHFSSLRSIFDTDFKKVSKKYLNLFDADFDEGFDADFLLTFLLWNKWLPQFFLIPVELAGLKRKMGYLNLN